MESDRKRPVSPIDTSKKEEKSNFEESLVNRYTWQLVHYDSSTSDRSIIAYYNKERCQRAGEFAKRIRERRFGCKLILLVASTYGDRPTQDTLLKAVLGEVLENAVLDAMKMSCIGCGTYGSSLKDHMEGCRMDWSVAVSTHLPHVMNSMLTKKSLAWCKRVLDALYPPTKDIEPIVQNFINRMSTSEWKSLLNNLVRHTDLALHDLIYNDCYE